MKYRPDRVVGPGFSLALMAACLLFSGCRQDMHDTPRYEVFEMLLMIFQLCERTVALVPDAKGLDTVNQLVG